MGLKGEKLKQYMDTNFFEAWASADAAGDGKVEAARMGQFMKSLAHDYTLDLQWSSKRKPNRKLIFKNIR